MPAASRTYCAWTTPVERSASASEEARTGADRTWDRTWDRERRPATRGRAGRREAPANEGRARAASVDACADVRDMGVRAIEGARTEVRGGGGAAPTFEEAYPERNTRAGRV